MTRRLHVRYKPSPPAPTAEHAEPHPRAVGRRALARFLTRNQCPHCLGWSAGARRLAEQMAGRRGHIRSCCCGSTVVPAGGQESLDFGGAA